MCTRPCVSVWGTRWTRWTPDSYFNLLYTRLPLISITYVLYPPFSAWNQSRYQFQTYLGNRYQVAWITSELETGVYFQELSSLYFWYMRTWRKNQSYMLTITMPSNSINGKTQEPALRSYFSFHKSNWLSINMPRSKRIKKKWDKHERHGYISWRSIIVRSISTDNIILHADMSWNWYFIYIPLKERVHWVMCAHAFLCACVC